MSYYLSFKNVDKSFYMIKEETKVLENINFEVNKGEIVAIVGPSGCGKSTILNLICNLIKPDSGEIKINGKIRSEEHTSELQSRFDLVCRLLLEKKKNN